MKILRTAMILVFALLALLGASPADEARISVAAERTAREARIQALRQRIGEAHARELAVQREERQILQEVQDAERQIAALERRLKELAAAAGVQEQAAPEEIAATAAGGLSLRPRSVRAVDDGGAVLAGQAIRIGAMGYFAFEGRYGFLRERSAGMLPEFVAASPRHAAAIEKLFGGERPEFLPMDFSGEWRPAVEEVDVGGVYRAWRHFAAGGVVMLPILLCAWLTLWVLIRRLILWGRMPVRRVTAGFAASLQKSAAAGSLSDDAFRKAEEEAQQLVTESSRGQGILSACAGVTPLLGLLGTVTGMIRTFTALGAENAASAALADGIAEALITTEAGLIVAIPAVLLHAWGRRRTARLSAALENQLKHYE